jgi:phage terminase large subunit
MYSITTATRKVASLKKKIRAICGGTSASKTISILLYLIHRSQSDKQKTLTSVVAESTPHLKRGAMRDFKNIMIDHKYWKDDLWSATDSIYTFETGSQIEFFSSDQPDKLRGARRDRCFMNEANNMQLDTFDQLEVRTKELMFLDWNPTNEYWFYTDVLNNRDDVEFITLTYKDNEALSKEIIQSIEARMNRKGWWQVYGLGQLGEVEGKIYKDWQIIDEIPHEARLVARGLDFGYSNDPSAIVSLYYYNGGYILNEELYRKGMSNKQLADFINNLDNPQTMVVADSAEPKSIDEIKMYGVNIIPTTKGPGSVVQGIQYVQDQRISMTARSTYLIKEYRNYIWSTDKDGKILNIPESGWDHALDSARYAILSQMNNIEVSTQEEYDKLFAHDNRESVIYSDIGL